MVNLSLAGTEVELTMVLAVGVGNMLSATEMFRNEQTQTLFYGIVSNDWHNYV